MSEEIRELGWEDEISDEGKEYSLFEEGDYKFTVEKFERARFKGSEKMPPCNMAKVTFTIWGADDKIEITENFLLNSKMEWKLSALFLAIGLKKHGEPLKMKWNQVTGAKGKCHVFIDTYTNKNGEEKKINRIKKFYDYDKDIKTVEPQTPKTESSQTVSGGGWKPGAF